MRHILLRLVILLSVFVPVLEAGAKDFVVVLDPGHGGRDAGALGLKTNEKTVNLKVALKLKKLIEDGMKDAAVHMTRETDRFVQLQGRADFANSRKADVFISIHANSLDRKSPSYARVNGAAVYTLGLDRSDTNLAVAMRENAVMKLEDDYSTVYEGFDPSSAESYIAFEMMQHKNMDQSIALAEAVQNQLVRTAGRKNNGVRQAPFWVLVRTSMPAILVELDFISNPQMEKYMASESGSSTLAKAIYNGLERYRKGNGRPSEARRDSDRSRRDEPAAAPAAKPERKPAAGENAATGDIVYKIQFMTSPKVLTRGHKNFRGVKDVEYYKEGGMYKYTTGSYATLAEANKALAGVRQKFHDAFVIKTRDGRRIR